MILSTVADRLTAFTVRGPPHRAEAALRASNARNFRTIVSSPHLRLFRDSNIRVRLLVSKLQTYGRKKKLNVLLMLEKIIKNVYQICIKLLVVKISARNIHFTKYFTKWWKIEFYNKTND